MPKIRQLTEQEILADSSLAQEFLALRLLKIKGRLYFLTDTLYSEYVNTGVGSVIRNRNAQGLKIPDGLDKFIESAVGKSDCVGIVPLTEGAQKAIEARGLKPDYGTGLKLEGVSFNAYR